MKFSLIFFNLNFQNQQHSICAQSHIFITVSIAKTIFETKGRVHWPLASAERSQHFFSKKIRKVLRKLACFFVSHRPPTDRLAGGLPSPGPRASLGGLRRPRTRPQECTSPFSLSKPHALFWGVLASGGAEPPLREKCMSTRFLSLEEAVFFP